MPEVGERVPDFTLPSTQGQLQLSQVYETKQVVLAFYTEDATPSCTQELASFKEEYSTIQELGQRWWRSVWTRWTLMRPSATRWTAIPSLW